MRSQIPVGTQRLVHLDPALEARVVCDIYRRLGGRCVEKIEIDEVTSEISRLDGDVKQLNTAAQQGDLKAVALKARFDSQIEELNGAITSRVNLGGSRKCGPRNRNGSQRPLERLGG